jgi:Right handed beta helix region
VLGGCNAGAARDACAMGWRPISGLLVAGALVLASCACHERQRAVAPPAAIADRCDHYADPDGDDAGPGTRARPFRTVQRLARAMGGGGTGCARRGTYHGRVRITRGGEPGRPLVLRGEGAVLAGSLWIDGADHVEVRGMVIDGSHSSEIPLQVMGDDVLIEGNALTTEGRQRSCALLGSNQGYGAARRTTIRGNRFDRCGDPAHGNKDHALYVENARDGEIVRNVVTGAAAYAVQLYPNAQGMRVAGNVMRDNGGGVIIAGDERLSSGGNVIERNVITGSMRFRGVESYWAGPVGTGNVVRDNCLWGGVPEALGVANGFAALDNSVAPPGSRCERLVARAASAHRAASRRSSSAS